MLLILKKILPFFKNKYFLASLVFVVWLTFFDQNNIIDRFFAIQKYKQMEKDRKYYIEKIKSDNKKLEELRTDRENLEKFAREQYLMKKADEDIFIVVED